MTNQAAMERLKGTVSGDKNEILFSQFGINYNEQPQVFRKGTVLYKNKMEPMNEEHMKDDDGVKKAKTKRQQEKAAVFETKEENCDIISDPFWNDIVRLEEFGWHDKALSARNIAIDKLESFSKW